MSGITGINVAKARSDIAEFEEAGERASKEFAKCFDYLLEGLYQSWASPIARTFTTEIKSKTVEIHRNMETEQNNILMAKQQATDTLSAQYN